MALSTDAEIREALKTTEVEIEPFNEDSLQAASYDMRLGDKGIITRTVSIEELRGKIQKEDDKLPTTLRSGF